MSEPTPDLTIGPARRISYIKPGPGVIIPDPDNPPTPETLDALADVDGATAGATGQVLRKSADGIWRPATPTGGPGETQLPHRHVQPTPATIWTVQHNLGYDPPAAYVVDAQGQQAWPDRRFLNVDAFELDWGNIASTGYCLTR
jgi:hypothetical protein